MISHGMRHYGKNTTRIDQRQGLLLAGETDAPGQQKPRTWRGVIGVNFLPGDG